MKPNLLKLSHFLSVFTRLCAAVILSFSPMTQASSLNNEQILAGTNIMPTLICKYGPSDDCISAPISLPFSFPFYGQIYQTFHIDTNGFITLRQPSNYNPGYAAPNSTTIDRDIPKSSNTVAPTPTPINNPDAVIAPFWDDLDMSSSGGVIRYVAINDAAGNPEKMVIQWVDAGFWKVPKPMGTFQVILYRTGDIQFQYRNIMPEKATQTRNQGGKATIGIENETGTCGVKYSYKGKNAAGQVKLVRSEQAIRFSATTPTDCNAYTLNENATYEPILLSDTPPTPLPDTPNLTMGVTPAPNATGISSTNTVFNWSDVNWNGVTGANHYRILVSTDCDLKTTPNPLTIDSNSMSSDYTATNLQPNTTYHWTVVAINGAGGTAWANETLSFTTGAGVNPLPTEPDLTTVSPANLATGVATSLTFNWENVSNATSYKLWISTNAELNPHITPLVIDVADLADSHYATTNLQPNTTYYWTVAAVNAAGITWSNRVLSFTTLLNPPAIPTLTGSTPANNAVNIPTTNISFDWQPVFGATGYRLLIATTVDLSTPLFDVSVTDSSFIAANLSANTTYYWTVIANNAAGNTPADSTFSFTTVNNSSGGTESGGSGTGSGDTGDDTGSAGSGTGSNNNHWAGYSVILRTSGTGTGRIVEQNCPIGSYNPVTLYTALPDNGSRFVRWEGNVHSADCYSTRASVAVTINAIKTCTAVFEKLPVTEEIVSKTMSYDRYPECMTAYRNTVAAYYLPGETNAGQATVHITNNNDFPTEVRGSLFHQTGYLLGRYNTVLVETLAPHATKQLTIAELAKQVGANAWEGLAWLQIHTPNGISLLNTLRNENNVVENMSLTSDHAAYNLPSRANTEEQAYVVVVNLTNEKLDVYGSLYQKDGKLLGRANSALMYNVPARGIRVLSMSMLEYMTGAPTWQGRARVQLTAPVIGIKVFNILLHRDGSLSNMSAMTDHELTDLSYGTENFVRITNVTDEIAQVTGTLFDNKDNVLGQSAELVIPPQATIVLSTAELAEKFNVTSCSWEGHTRLVTTATTAIKLMATARINGILINKIDRIPETVSPATM